ncbi:MAG: leuA 1 [Firmicutes bacterium]|nr:leuA 1 [Bacillota bacterium]
MKADFTFIDQTLGEALERRYLDISEFICVKQKIATLSQFVFDLTVHSLLAVLHYDALVVKDIRVCIQPNLEQVAQVHQCGCRNVKISLNYKDVRKLPDLVAQALSEACKWQMTISLHITGSCRYEASDILYLGKIIKEYSISSIIFDDEDSELDSVNTYCTLLDLQKQIPCPIEYYGKNAMGLATGNALGAIKSGIRYIAVSVGGVAGYPAFEEVLMGARYLLNFPLDVPPNMAIRCEELLSYVGQSVKATKAIIGSYIFAHESGIHVDGVNKKSDLYEPFTPETVGLIRKIIIGKHSGKAAIELKLKEMNIFVLPIVVIKVLEKVRGLAIRQKAPVSDLQLQKLVYEVA